MAGFRIMLLLGMVAALAAGPDRSRQLLAQEKAEIQYEVMSPWADVDPIPLKGISPRIDKLAGKKIGLFVNYKRAARPIGVALEKKLRSMFPDVEISMFHSPEWNVTEIETKDRDKFITWAKGVEAAILLVGD